MSDSEGIPVGAVYQTHKDDYRSAFTAILRGPTGAAIDLTGLSPEFSLDQADNTNIIANTNTGVTIQPTTAFTVDTTLGLLKCTDHGLLNDDEVILAGTLPTELTAAIIYTVRKIDRHSFRLIAIGKTSPITAFATAGSGTLMFYIKGHVLYQWQSGDLATVSPEGSDYKARIRLPTATAGQYDTYPPEGWWPVMVNVKP